MPVIGRLDGQVDEIIISPISHRRREEEEPPAALRDEPTPEPTRPHDGATVQTPPIGESSPKTDELPVWLL